MSQKHLSNGPPQLADIVIAIVDLLSIPFQIVGEILASIIAYIFQSTFSKPRLNDQGQPDKDDTRPSNRWEILGYSLLGTVTLTLLVGGICFIVWQSLFAAQCGAGVAAFIGIMGAFKAAIE